MIRLITVLGLIGFSLSGCASTDPTKLFAALGQDDADACGILTTAFPPYGGVFIFGRTKSPTGATIEASTSGCKITRNSR